MPPLYAAIIAQMPPDEHKRYGYISHLTAALIRRNYWDVAQNITNAYLLFLLFGHSEHALQRYIDIGQAIQDQT